MVRKLLTLCLVTGSLAIGGCNTLRGVGQDIQSVPDCVEGRVC